MADFVPNTALNNGKTPVMPAAKSYPLTFTSTVLSVELATGGQSTGNTLSPQSAVVDNTLGGSVFTLTVDGTAYQVNQGATQTFTLLSSEFPRIYASATAPGSVRVMLTNALLPPSLSGGSFNASQADLDKIAATVGTVPQPTALTTFSQPIIGGSAVSPTNPLPITQGDGIGANGNAWSAAAVAAAGVSATIDTGGLAQVSVYGSVSAATNISVNVSADGSTWWPSTQQAALTAAGDFYLNFATGARYLQLVSSAAATVTATISAK
jgi:hypothetical protein